jgi:hypothetical protein
LEEKEGKKTEEKILWMGWKKIEEDQNRHFHTAGLNTFSDYH